MAGAGKGALEVGKRERRRAMRVQGKRHAQDDVAAALRGVQPAGPIAKATVLIGPFHNRAGVRIETANGVDGLRNLLPIGADILHGGPTGGPGDAGEAFHAGKVGIDGVLHQRVPRCAGSGMDKDPPLRVRGLGSDASQSDMKHKAGKTGVGDKQVTAAAKDEQRGTQVLLRQANGLLHVVLGVSGGKPARRSADAQGGVGGERDVFFDRKRRQRNSPCAQMAAARNSLQEQDRIKQAAGVTALAGRQRCIQRSWSFRCAKS